MRYDGISFYYFKTNEWILLDYGTLNLTDRYILLKNFERYNIKAAVRKIEGKTVYLETEDNEPIHIDDDNSIEIYR